MAEERIELTQLLGPEPAEGLASLLGVDLPDLESDGLPLLGHWMYLTRWPDQRDIGSDGHPVRGVVPTPPGPGRRRMWAGGRVTQLRPLRIGSEATRHSQVLTVDEKSGRSGPLTIVTVGHTISQDGAACVQEEQNVVYRDAAPATPAAPGRGPAASERGPSVDGWEIPVDPTALFRFSALTRNTHRIHYDQVYAHEVEGYDGLVVHGPLQAVAMAEAARARSGEAPRQIGYRLVAPLLSQQGMVATAADQGAGAWETTIRDAGGRTTATGTVRVAGETESR